MTIYTREIERTRIAEAAPCVAARIIETALTKDGTLVTVPFRIFTGARTKLVELLAVALKVTSVGAGPVVSGRGAIPYP